jgi:7-cyano-7-deazaguanine synthase
MSKALVLLSGGIDSAAALHWASQNHQEIGAISFHYHQRPRREILAVHRLLQIYPAKLYEVPVSFLTELHREDVPEGYIPNRNMIFYSIAAYYAEVSGSTSIVGGHTVEDQNPFPDASLPFFEALQNLINSALLKQSIEIELPLGHMNKLQVLEKAVAWKVPLEHTWSCYRDGSLSCGKCVSCIERMEVFQQLGLTDPLLANKNQPQSQKDSK